MLMTLEMLSKLTLVVMVPSWFLSKTVKASLKVASSSAVRESWNLQQNTVISKVGHVFCSKTTCLLYYTITSIFLLSASVKAAMLLA